jgi:hypothetical protein
MRMEEEDINELGLRRGDVLALRDLLQSLRGEASPAAAAAAAVHEHKAEEENLRKKASEQEHHGAHVMVFAPFPVRCFRAACFAHIKYASMVPQLEAVPAHLIATFSYMLEHRWARLRLRHVRRRRPQLPLPPSLIDPSMRR